MLTQQNLILPLTLVLSAAAAGAGPIVYVTTYTGQFGTLNPTTGAFTQIGPSTADPLNGLVAGPNGNLLGVSFSGNLVSINPATGATSVIGATGLGGSVLDTAELNGTVYETDFGNNLYTVKQTTGAASLIGYTGIPPAPSDPNDLIDESFFSVSGSLYATFDAFNMNTMALVIPPDLYQINPTTGVATLIGPTAFQLDAAIGVNGTVYGFTAANTVLSLNLANGSSTFVTNYDPGAFFITGAAQTPEPGSFVLVGMGIAAALISRRRMRRS